MSVKPVGDPILLPDESASYDLRVLRSARFVKANGQIIGVEFRHVTKDDPSKECEGSPSLIQWEPYGEPKPLSTLVSGPGEAITVEPHVICPVCKDAGWIRGGKWVPLDLSVPEPDESEMKMADPEIERLLAEEEEIETITSSSWSGEVKTLGPFFWESKDGEQFNLRKKLLEEALSITTGDRNVQYGPPHADFARTAEMVTAMWRHKLKDDVKIEAHEVAQFIMCVKLSRLQWSPHNYDSHLDIAGYAACGYEAYVLTREEEDDERKTD